MTRKTVFVICTLFALATGALMVGTCFRPLSWSGPETLGPTAYALAIRGQRLVAHYWRYTSNPPAANRSLNVGPILLYEMEVKAGARSLSYSWLDPFPHGLTASATRGTLVTTKLGLTLWLPLAVFSAYPIAVLIRAPLRRKRRRKRGLCLRCGYDLTGNVSGVCPECGEGTG